MSVDWERVKEQAIEVAGYVAVAAVGILCIGLAAGVEPSDFKRRKDPEPPEPMDFGPSPSAPSRPRVKHMWLIRQQSPKRRH